MLEHLFDNTLLPSESTKSLPTLDDLSDHVFEIFETEIEKRIRYLQSADPDPYGLHKIPIETRLIYMEHYLITGNYLI